ncbi:unnamed protein product, partial [Vitis vinifera]
MCRHQSRRMDWNGCEEADKEYMTQIRRLYSYMTPFVSKSPRGSFLNYRDVDIGVTKTWSYDEGKVYGAKYFMNNFDRLVKVKTALHLILFLWRNIMVLLVIGGRRCQRICTRSKLFFFYKRMATKGMYQSINRFCHFCHILLS